MINVIVNIRKGCVSMDLRDAVMNTFMEKERTVIIGLTGRTGAGCSTVAKILESEDFETLDLRDIQQFNYEDLELRKQYIINKFMKSNKKWHKFETIDVSSVIVSFVFENDMESLKKFFSDLKQNGEKEEFFINGKDDLDKAITSLQNVFDEVNNFNLEDETWREKKEEYYKFYLYTLKVCKQRFKNVLEQYSCYSYSKDGKNRKIFKQYNFYTFFMQKVANNLRASGSPFESNFKPKHNTIIAERIRKIIEIVYAVKEKNFIRICVDAIRNQYEALYLRDTFKSFYLISINTTDNDRKSRLTHLNNSELENLDEVEYVLKFNKPEDGFYHQNILSCTEIADIHISNPNIKNGKYYVLTEQLVRYIALMLHPGIIVPSALERCMQLAYNAKFNSGCLSRQVGAVVTREDYSVQSVGWNDVPKGQVPCNMRDVHGFCINKDIGMYSKFELENVEFYKVLKDIDSVLIEKNEEICMPYCFKDVYNGIKNDKNQVYTRSLHAEENAFLQISKYGGTEVRNGCLFTTASPCELCAKKAYQLGIKKIYYIDPYPGISQDHILTFGEEDNPEVILFQGAIGDAYVDLYRPRIPIKDEMEMLTDINVKEFAKGNHKKNNLKYGDVEYQKSLVELRFNSDRTDVETRRYVKIKFLKDGIESIYREFDWTESTFEGITLDREGTSKGVTLKELSEASPFAYAINLGKKSRKGSVVEYNAIINAKDEKKIMEPFLGHYVEFKTKKLDLRIVIPESIKDLFKNLEFVVYADKDKKIETNYGDLNLKKKNDCLIYYKSWNNPNVNYMYGIRWKFGDDLSMNNE